MFHFRCPHCNAKLEAEDDWAGMEAACPKCSQTITIVPETTPEKPKIQLTPITVPSSAIATAFTTSTLFHVQQIPFYLSLLRDFN